MSCDPKKPRSLHNSIWSDTEFWREYRAKWEAMERELLAERQSSWRRIAAKAEEAKADAAPPSVP